MPEASKPAGKKSKIKYFGTFQGVFTPTALTILGVIMYIRHPWVVGNAGILGAMVILAISVSITLFTSLSMASMTTNIRIESGGAFSIISQSLGLEIGGSIGIPLYLAQACVVAMYIFGFREGWLWIYPDHPPILVDIITFAIIAIIAGISADIAFKIQYVIMVVIFGSIISIVLGAFQAPVDLEQ
jgi:solute carrier family 12 sodium/potassium/chloride transporter 2